MVDIPQVQPDPAGHVCIGADFSPITQNLSQTGNTGPNGQPPHVSGNPAPIRPGLAQHVWTGANDGHIPPQHIEELRQLVQRRPPQEMTYARDTFVILRSLPCIRLVIHHHRPELQADERLVIQPTPPLPEQHRPLGRALDGKTYEKIAQRKQGTDKKKRYKYVKTPFQRHSYAQFISRFHYNTCMNSGHTSTPTDSSPCNCINNRFLPEPSTDIK